jgi:hypothetical protein
MALYLISYDLMKPEKDYPHLINRLNELGAERVLYSEWFFLSTATPEAIRNDLQYYGGLDKNDRVMVVELARNAAWDRLMLNDNKVLAYFNDAKP